MPKLFQKKEKRNFEKPEIAKSRWGGFWKVLAYIFLVVAIFLFVGGVFWQRAGIELTGSSISGMSQGEVLCKLLIEYITDPGAITGFASLALSIVMFSFERRQKDRERDKDISERLDRMRSLPFLQRLRKYRELEKRSKEESWSENRVEDLQQYRNSFSEREFLWEVGELLRVERKTNDLSDIQGLYNFFFTAHKSNIDALAKILNSSMITDEDALVLILSIVKLWDDFDADAKDLIIGALKKLSQQKPLSNISNTKLSYQIFNTLNRRRLLRDAEIRTLFLQLVSSEIGASLPVGYDATWQHLPRRTDNPKILDWLKQHTLVANPFGSNDLNHYPCYPQGFAHPDHWEDFFDPEPQCAQCATANDARALAFLLRSECLPVRKTDQQGNEILEVHRQTFPVWVSFEQTTPLELPLIVLARSAARAWMDILPSSPDAMLDLLPAAQEALLELLCWSFGSNNTVIDLLKRAGIGADKGGNLLIHRTEQFKNRFSSAHFPQDSILLSWLKIRPPELNCTYLILLIDEFPSSARSWWLEQFNLLISTLFLNGIVTKAFASSPIPVSLSLPVIQLDWSDAWLKRSLDSQFDVAIDKNVREEMGMAIRFQELFGPGVAEEQTTDKLISASRNSLAHMLMLGNRLLKHHCEREAPEKYLYVEELESVIMANENINRDNRDETL